MTVRESASACEAGHEIAPFRGDNVGRRGGGVNTHVGTAKRQTGSATAPYDPDEPATYTL